MPDTESAWTWRFPHREPIRCAQGELRESDPSTSNTESGRRWRSSSPRASEHVSERFPKSVVRAPMRTSEHNCRPGIVDSSRFDDTRAKQYPDHRIIALDIGF